MLFTILKHRNDMDHGKTNITFDENRGLQVAYNSGSIATHFHLPPERAETPPQPSIFIPFRRDLDFVDRGTLLDQIQERCSGPASRCALVGLGGVGKSQLAIEFAYRTRDRSSEKWVFWVHASNTARFEQSYRDIACYLKLPGRRDTKVNILQLVRDWLQDEGKGKWLIIVDNVDDATFLQEKRSGASVRDEDSRPLLEYVPQCQHGSVLITTRSKKVARQIADPRSITSVEPMNLGDSIALLEKKLGPYQESEKQFIEELAKTLEFIPLAIVQAAALISQRRPFYSVEKYLADLRKSDRKSTSLLKSEGGAQLRRDWEANNSILVTWQLSFHHIQQTRPSAADLLALMSFYDRQGIPECLLRNRTEHGVSPFPSSNKKTFKSDNNSQFSDSGDESKDDNSQSSITNENLEDDTPQYPITSEEFGDSISEASGLSDAFEDDIQTLRDYSFISVDKTDKNFEMHRLVQLAMRNWLRINEQFEKWNHKSIEILDAQLPRRAEYENWAVFQILFPHAKAAAAMERRPKESDALNDWASISQKAAGCAFRLGNGIEAESMYTQAMNVYKTTLGLNNGTTLESMALVASAFALQGQYYAAEELCSEIMRLSKQNIGADDHLTLTSLNHLGLILCYQGRYDAAKKMLMKVLESSKRKLGRDHACTIDSMSYLAIAIRNLGNYKASEELQTKGLEIRREKYGEDHHKTLSSMNNLALTYKDQGELAAAEQLQMVVMEAFKKNLGEDHPETLTSMCNLALTYRDQMKLDVAEEMQLKVLEARKTKLGAQNPLTLGTMSDLASTYMDQRRLNAAEELQMEVLNIQKKKIGEDHPDTLTSMNNLAWTWKMQRGHDAQAIKLMRTCVERTLRILGASHPRYLSSSTHLAAWEAEQVEEICHLMSRLRIDDSS